MYLQKPKTSEEGEFGFAVFHFSSLASERAVDGEEWWTPPLGSQVPQTTLLSLQGVRGNTFLLVTEAGVLTNAASPGSSVDRIDAVWQGWRPEPGQEGGGSAEHRHGSGVASEGGSSGPASKARTLRQG